MNLYHPRYDDAPDPREFIDTCPTCEGAGWIEYDTPIHGLVYCACDTGKERRRIAVARLDADWQAANDAGLWENPDLWPW